MQSRKNQLSLPVAGSERSSAKQTVARSLCYVAGASSHRIQYQKTHPLAQIQNAENGDILTVQTKPTLRNSVSKTRTSSPATILGLFVMLCAAMTSSGCRSYHLGNQYLFRSDIRTVHVAIADSNSNRRFLGQRLTEAVVKQISNTTPLTITEPALADSVITARVIRDRKSVLTETVTDEGRAVDVGLVVEVDWTDRAGTPLMPRQSLKINHSADFIPEGGQSLVTAQQEVIERIAREIVGQMETPW